VYGYRVGLSQAEMDALLPASGKVLKLLVGGRRDPGTHAHRRALIVLQHLSQTFWSAPLEVEVIWGM
jgi:hypothetical protein